MDGPVLLRRLGGAGQGGNIETLVSGGLFEVFHAEVEPVSDKATVAAGLEAPSLQGYGTQAANRS